MITYLEIPPELAMIDDMSKQNNEKLQTLLSGYGTDLHCQNGFDLLTLPPPALFLFINKGVFKFFYGNKLVRLYETGDIVPLFTRSPATDCRCISEFGADISVYNNEEIAAVLAHSPECTACILDCLALQSRLMHILCALFTNEDTMPDMSFQTFESGTTIIAEGAPAHEIYLMVQGKAVVTVQSVEVGEISPGEVFGEISFFTTGSRSATVTAASECLVQVMRKDGFLSLIKLKPSINLAISRQLSQRLIETNRKIVEQK